ncbi:RelA/SpoT family protein [Bacteroides pyogenes]|uniref:Bifunctional (P)ppGpp synthetase/guanosine-3',5'-bis(Diphosphate) 3'-pyrophosphohydrolase n=2 Tax=Bacteroides pyogenes TaxID=310300 RepID=A0A5D3EDF9_9BACE|nr:RelA/SpoT family protein [Bacteroides pyogenes]GAE15418.1 glycosyl transferase [Bacteroides pyogenes JCM 6292]MBR8709696.1 Guanosine-3',5'-bis(diphosphate) 3'-pyrophosphohydrolase [Bacteroides pyogenes]MBR8718588.1 Guanosine-3',5'-bis(diphosphate) 3'-pyrophosphohydrolase [Bacteroides pyogenes]MBR8748048.1 Guanosine-3',5'-bis(diphosphate) 3'-pyrophosphohydrolase [Bacteroides pyogenes]MBR8758340.1 Guanosine-3',5'-bis(diphosphate) 3'-pyrophosphohydrolase [Bacteroides pyogenes]
MDNLPPKEMTDEEMIEQEFQKLLTDYLGTKHRKRIEIITKAFNFANQAHKGIKRRSGEPYILHPIAVAKIVCNEIGLGSTSICAALLHDVVEDTDYTVEDIENIFGPKIAQIVDGLTKISGGIFGDHASAQAENFKKLLLTMSSDIRVILIKIADRLHNMRTLGSMLPNKQYKIAGETLYIYAPLANRLGLYKIKTELENLSFKYEHPEEYVEIEEKLNATAAERDKVFNEFTSPIRTQLDKMGLKYRLIARVKSIYSIWNKMQTKHIPFEEIYDLLAVRIIFEPRNQEEELNDCFDIYVTISKIYKPHPDRLRDWVSHPKANGYQALHVTLMGNNGQWIEVQIRSERMNDVAEQGFAAHWKYKEGGGSEDEGELEKWLKTVKEILDDPQPDAIDFLDTIKLNLFASEIFVFTPKGELKTMPQNSTALDFAFSLHTDIGSHCIGAKVNHKLVPISHKLQSGDQVEILTSKSQRVQPQWELFATTARARTKIAAILRKEQKANQKKGEKLLNEFLQKEEIRLEDSVIEKLCRLHRCKDSEELLAAIGSENIVLGEADRNELKEKQSSSWKKYLTFSFGNSKEKPEEKKTTEIEKINLKQILKLTEESLQKTYIMAECCHPIPGDDVLGYIDEKNRIIIHKRQCPVAAKLKSSYGNRILATEWDTHKELSFLVYIYIKGIDSVGLLNDITQVISKQMNVNMRKLNIETNDGIFEGKIQLWVHDVEDVRSVCNNLRKIKNIKQVSRIEE